MAKEQKPTEQLGEIAEQAMEQARRAADIYFDYVKQAISATPSGGNEFAESLKECAEKKYHRDPGILKAVKPSKEFPRCRSRPERLHEVLDECVWGTKLRGSLHQNSGRCSQEAAHRYA